MGAIAAPTASRATLLRRDELVATLHGLVSTGRVIHDEQGRRVYAADAFDAYSALPLAVVLPANTREVSQVLKFCYETGLKIFPRGAGTSLVGGAVAAEDGIVLCLSRMNRVLDVDPANRMVRVEAGITNAAVSAAVAGRGLRYAPDPASRLASTIGGNIATNAGGARALKFGATAQHVLALKLVLIDGEVIELGSGELEASGFDMVGLIVGSEGMLGVVVEATLRVVPEPEARRLVLLGFQSISAAIACASNILSTTANLSAMEIIDRQVATACEDFANAGLPRNADGLLLIEIEGHDDEISELSASILVAATDYAPIVQLEITEPAQIAKMWQACDSAYTALGRLGSVRCVDIAIPPAQLAEAMSQIGAIAARHSLPGASMCRAAEGLVHSVFIYDGNQPEAELQVIDAIADVAQMTAKLGGVLAGEHGIGVAKREALGHLLTAPDLTLQMRLKSAFDTEWLLNNGKVYPLAEQSAHMSVV